MARDGAKDKPATLKVSVLVVAYQSGPHLADCLAALEAQTFRDFEIVVVDNASTDGAPARALAAHPSARLIEAGSNLGFAAGMNLAAREARSLSLTCSHIPGRVLPTLRVVWRVSPAERASLYAGASDPGTE